MAGKGKAWQGGVRTMAAWQGASGWRGRTAIREGAMRRGDMQFITACNAMHRLHRNAVRHADQTPAS
jgi:hypothetical protein